MSNPQPLPVRQEAIAPGTETCGCCEGIDPSTPRLIHNRPGLSAIAYRIGRYSDFQESLRAGLSSSKYPQLAKLLTRDTDDFTVGLIDAFACAADVLTFYQERIAQESYLRTALERVSMQELGRLIGYRLRPGLAAETWLAFALESPSAPPANLPPEPGNFVTGVPSEITLEIGTKVQSVPGPDEKPQLFETVEALQARPEWSAMRPWMNEVVRPGRHHTTAYLSGVRNSLKPGDALLFLGDEYVADENNDNWDFRVLDGVELQPEFDRTKVTWRRGLGSLIPFTNPAQSPQVWVLRKRSPVYGHNAPRWQSMSQQFRIDYGDTDLNDTEWPNFTLDGRERTSSGISLTGNLRAPQIQARALGGSFGITDDITGLGVAEPLIGAGSPVEGIVEAVGSGGVLTGVSGTSTGNPRVDLDAVYSEISPGGYAVLAKGSFNYPNEPSPAGTYVELYKISSVAEVSRAEFALSGKVTRLRLRGENYATFVDSVRETVVFAQSEALALARYPVETAVAGAQVPVSVNPDGLEAGRKLIVRGNRVSNGAPLVHYATLQSVVAHVNGAVLTIAPPLPAPLGRTSVVVYANVALASHGETVTQILGAGDASQAFQRFELKQVPLTFRAAATELGADSELTLRIGDIAWSERATLYGAAATERAYALDLDERGRQWVRFGDGVSGARLPGGVNNVRATYRKGLGVAGNVRAETLTQPLSRPLGLKSVSNPSPAEGGTDPEDAQVARATMPLMTRTLGRAVSVLDYEDYAQAFTGIAKAQAAVLRTAAGTIVAITIAGPDNAVLTATNPVWQNLAAALKESGDPHVRVQLLPHQASTFHIGLRVKIDPAYETKSVLGGVEIALRAHYAFFERALGQPVLQSDVIACAQAVPGVLAVDLDLLYGGTKPLSQTLRSRQVRLLASRMRVENGAALAAELLTLHPGPLAKLEVIT